MKVAYIFATESSRMILEKMIVPQLMAGNHGAEVAGMFFFVDNTFLLLEGNTLAEKLNSISEKTGMMLMACNQCAFEREIDKKLVSHASIGCFPDLYGALSGAGIDQVITL